MGIDFNEGDTRNTLLDEGKHRFMLEHHLNNPTEGHEAKVDEEIKREVEAGN